MIGYTTLGTNDLPRAAAFYDELFGVIGVKRMMDFGRGYAWGVGMDKPGFGVMLPFNGEPATVGNGVMVALVVNSRDKVDALYAKALALGGSDEGVPGERGEGFYAAYFRDLDGNKLNAFCVG
jgi:catechol 2,3-dioxygenase-like lactoylglutathione lyase family enzyme